MKMKNLWLTKGIQKKPRNNRRIIAPKEIIMSTLIKTSPMRIMIKTIQSRKMKIMSSLKKRRNTLKLMVT